MVGLALAIGLLPSVQAQVWQHGPISTTLDTAIVFGNGARSVRYVILHDVMFHGEQEGNWLNDGALFLRNGELVDPDTGCKLGYAAPDVLIPILKLDYCRPVPLWYAVGNPEAHGTTAIFSAMSVEYQ